MPEMRKRRISVLCLLVLLGGGCAPGIPQVPDHAGAPPTTTTTGLTSLFSAKDAELFQRALARLNAAGNNPVAVDNYAGARADLEALLETYPESKWRPAASTIIALLDAVTSQRQLMDKALADKSRLVQENDLVKRQARALHEKLQVEIVRLTQENEQLKKDIQTLKNLEIELEKRDRKLR